MAGLPKDADGPIVGINVTPLVDVTLVLLVIFIVTAKFVVTRALPLDLPVASRTQEVQVMIAVNVPAAGPLLVDGTPAGDDVRFVALVRAARARSPEARAVVGAEGSVPHERVLHALDLLRDAGVERIAFAARDRRTP